MGQGKNLFSGAYSRTVELLPRNSGWLSSQGKRPVPDESRRSSRRSRSRASLMGWTGPTRRRSPTARAAAARRCCAPHVALLQEAGWEAERGQRTGAMASGKALRLRDAARGSARIRSRSRSPLPGRSLVSESPRPLRTGRFDPQYRAADRRTSTSTSYNRRRGRPRSRPATSKNNRWSVGRRRADMVFVQLCRREVAGDRRHDRRHAGGGELWEDFVASVRALDRVLISATMSCRSTTCLTSGWRAGRKGRSSEDAVGQRLHRCRPGSRRRRQ